MKPETLELIAQLPDYWSHRYPEATVEYPNGRKVERDDLIDYYQDVRITELEERVRRMQHEAVDLWAAVAEAHDALDEEDLRPLAHSHLADQVEELEHRLENTQAALSAALESFPESAPSPKWPWILLGVAVVAWPPVSFFLIDFLIKLGT